MKDVDRDAGADRQRGLLQPFPRLGAERVGAGQALAVAEQGEVAVGLGVGARVGRGLGDVGQASGRAEPSSGAPTAAACGSVNSTRGTAS